MPALAHQWRARTAWMDQRQPQRPKRATTAGRAGRQAPLRRARDRPLAAPPVPPVPAVRRRAASLRLAAPEPARAAAVLARGPPGVPGPAARHGPVRRAAGGAAEGGGQAARRAWGSSKQEWPWCGGAGPRWAPVISCFKGGVQVVSGRRAGAAALAAAGADRSGEHPHCGITLSLAPPARCARLGDSPRRRCGCTDAPWTTARRLKRL